MGKKDHDLDTNEKMLTDRLKKLTKHIENSGEASLPMREIAPDVQRTEGVDEDVKRLESMMGMMQGDSGGDPEMEQINDVLGKILDSGGDLYEAIWKEVTNLECNELYREKSKSIFLPVVYGQGVDSVAERGLGFAQVRSANFDGDQVAVAQGFEVVGLGVPHRR